MTYDDTYGTTTHLIHRLLHPQANAGAWLDAARQAAHGYDINHELQQDASDDAETRPTNTLSSCAKCDAFLMPDETTCWQCGGRLD